MINYNNQFLLSFKLGDNNDFIDANDLKHFNLYFIAGNIRPSMEISFTLQDLRLVPYFNCGNILTISFGSAGEIKKDVLQFQLTNDMSDLKFSVGSEVALKGYFYKPSFLSHVGYDYQEDKTSYEVISEYANKYKFNLVSNIGKTNDRQNWYRVSDTPWNFLQYVWLHAYTNDNTFFSYGMDCDNLYFYDMRELTQKGAKWMLTNLSAGENAQNTISIPGVKTVNNYGGVSDLIGKNLQISVYDVDKGILELQDYRLKSFGTVDTNKLNINSSGSLDYDYGIISDDVHKNFVKAYNQNVRNNLMYQTFEIYASTYEFKKVKLLDPVMFNMYPYDARLQGTAFITGITYQFEPGQFKLNLTINKEAPSGIKGSELDVAG